ncbi:hypothetical protein G6F70_006410 [Rhizopus microsporus]|uniref:Uncharacterized protein n=2 Tax=Rhizopus TaxID=4842 RepID=A0A367IVB6_RHIAZ|nr:hypothetical protein G6F71_006314 [Rhizopus microsporus]RCH81617.1 hypothetical protein CU097_002961 [Rhizopus azygosporus]KAG1197713.1 hypothetical protein G6F70_006410 [Rhizopus microsporus]KAG1209515.1 hypothetical protein G6F69_006293 [Rhizopus microsporus]KAG1230960.1 hypothetical protein G6F67_006104 [Rhizopus microsporus]
MQVDSYEQYADELLSRVFENAKQNQSLSSPISDWSASPLLCKSIDQTPILSPSLSNRSIENAFSPVIKSPQSDLVSGRHVDVSSMDSKSIILPPAPTSPIPPSLPSSPIKQQKNFLHDTLSRKLSRKKKEFKSVKKPLKAPLVKSNPSQEPLEPSQEQQERPQIQRQPSFWKPREDRPNEWWKSKKGQGEQSLKQHKVASIRAKKPKRPMAFKTPKRKPVAHTEKKKASTQSHRPGTVIIKRVPQKQAISTDASISSNETIAVAPVSATMPQPVYMVQQPYAMIPPVNHAGYYLVPSMMMPAQPQQPQIVSDKPKPQQVKRKKVTTLHNPREASNDKCILM